MIQHMPFYEVGLCKGKASSKETITMVDLVTSTSIMMRIEYIGMLLMRVAQPFQTQIITALIRGTIQMTDKLMMMIISVPAFKRPQITRISLSRRVLNK